MTTFDQCVRELFKVLTNIIERREKTTLNLTNKPNPIQMCLKKYMRVYDQTDPSEHIGYFQTIYSKYRHVIIRGYRNNSWLQNESVIIQFGDGVPGVRNSIKIMLSAFYTTACKLRDDAERRLDGLPVEARENQPELDYPDQMMLQLYRTFRAAVTDDSDKQALTKCLAELETELVDQPATEGPAGLVTMATELMNRVGMPTPEGMPTGKDFNDMVTNVLNNPTVNNVVGNMFKDIQDCNDITSVLQKLLTNLSDPSLTQAIQETMGSTVEGAVEATVEEEVEYDAD